MAEAPKQILAQAPHLQARWRRFGPLALAGLGVCVALYGIAAATLLPSRWVREFDAHNAESDCCRRGIPPEDACERAIRNLLSARGRKNSQAAERYKTCPAAQELDPDIPHPPEERLCGYTSIPAQREEAAKALAALKRLDVTLLA